MFNRYGRAARALRQRKLHASSKKEARCKCEWCRKFRYKQTHLLPHTDMYYADQMELMTQLGRSPSADSCHTS